MTNQSSLWVDRLARFGYGAKGVVYAIVGLLAAQAAFGIGGGKITDTTGALKEIVTQPFGKFFLALVAIGLVGHALWRFVEAFLDPENKGTNIKGILQRIGSGFIGLLYTGLAFSAVKIAFNAGEISNKDSTKDWTARIITQPFGQWLVGTAGAIIIGNGFYEFYKAYRTPFRHELRLDDINNPDKKSATRLGRFGLAARGVVFVIIGFFLIQAAHQFDANQARGFGGALQSLVTQPYGFLILAVVALGLIAYGIYQGVLAVHGRIIGPRLEEKVRSLTRR